MDHRINMRQLLPLTPLFPGLNLTYALKLLQLGFAVSEELGNKQTNRQTHSLIDKRFYTVITLHS